MKPTEPGLCVDLSPEICFSSNVPETNPTGHQWQIINKQRQQVLGSPLQSHPTEDRFNVGKLEKLKRKWRATPTLPLAPANISKWTVCNVKKDKLCCHDTKLYV